MCGFMCRLESAMAHPWKPENSQWESSLFPPRAVQELNSGGQVWWQAPYLQGHVTGLKCELLMLHSQTCQSTFLTWYPSTDQKGTVRKSHVKGTTPPGLEHGHDHQLWVTAWLPAVFTAAHTSPENHHHKSMIHGRWYRRHRRLTKAQPTVIMWPQKER